MDNPYIIVTALSKNELELYVNEKIENGYEPLGGVCVDFVSACMHTYYQAMCFKSDTGKIIKPSEMSKIDKEKQS